jgi:hypothetical protein
MAAESVTTSVRPRGAFMRLAVGDDADLIL